MRMPLSGACVCLFVASVGSLYAQVPSYTNDVRPILNKYCVECHQGNKSKAAVNLESYESLMKGSKKGRKTVVPDQPDKSRLVMSVEGKSGHKMPPKKASAQPTPKEIAVLRAWVEGGAKDDTSKQSHLEASLGAADVREDFAKKDLEKLQGTWILVWAERDGKKLPEEEVKKTRITFKNDTFVFPDASGIGTSQKGIIKIYPSKTPKWMDSKATDDTAKQKTSFGLYEITGDDYKVCFAPPGKDRPVEFTSKPGSDHILQVWKREKK